MYDVIAAGHRFKLVKETDHLKVALGGNVARRRREAHVIARSQQLVEALGGAGLKLQVGLDHLVANLPMATIDCLSGFAAVVMLLKDAHDVGQRTTDKLMDQRIINRESQLGRARLPRLDTQTLGIDQRSVHVKNNGIDHIGPPSLRASVLPQLYRTCRLVYNVYSILRFRYIDRSLMTSGSVGL